MAYGRDEKAMGKEWERGGMHQSADGNHRGMRRKMSGKTVRYLRNSKKQELFAHLNIGIHANFNIEKQPFSSKMHRKTIHAGCPSTAGGSFLKFSAFFQIQKTRKHQSENAQAAPVFCSAF